MKVISRKEGEVVGDGVSVTPLYESNDMHIKYQKTLANGDVVRLRIRIPRESPRDPNTWSWDEVLATKADIEANRQFQEKSGEGYQPKHAPENPAPPVGAGSCAVKPEPAE